MRLYDYFSLNTGRSITKNPHYFPVYERHFGRFVGQEVLMFEIGSGAGGSAGMWKQYFGPQARIVTVDIEDCSSIADAQIFPRRGDQADPVFLHGLLQEFGPPDIVLDDGSHMMKHIAASFDVLFPETRSVYLVEDLDGAYWPERGGGLNNPASFIERAKNMVDHMNGSRIGSPGFTPDHSFNLLSVNFYLMMVVLEKTRFLNQHLEVKPQR